MPSENAERLRGFLESWMRDAAWTPDAPRPGEEELALLHPEFVFEDTNLPDGASETYRGREGVLRAMERWIAPFEWVLVDFEDIIEIGDCIVSIHHWQARARDTGDEQDRPLAYVWTFRDGQVIHCRSYLDPEEAIAAAQGEHRDT